MAFLFLKEYYIHYLRYRKEQPFHCRSCPHMETWRRSGVTSSSIFACHHTAGAQQLGCTPRQPVVNRKGRMYIVSRMALHPTEKFFVSDGCSGWERKQPIQSPGVQACIITLHGCKVLDAFEHETCSQLCFQQMTPRKMVGRRIALTHSARAIAQSMATIQ